MPMTKHQTVLVKIEREHTISKETDYEFLFLLQNGLLLALKEQGRLNAMQYRHAVEKLKDQRCKMSSQLWNKRICR